MYAINFAMVLVEIWATTIFFGDKFIELENKKHKTYSSLMKITKAYLLIKIGVLALVSAMSIIVLLCHFGHKLY